MSLLRNTSWSALASFTSALGRMIVIALLGRRLGPVSFGIFVFNQWIIEVASLACSVGLPGTATRFFPQTAGRDAGSMPAFDRWFLRRAALAVVLTAGVATFATATLSHLTTGGALPAVAFWAASYAAWALLGARLQGLFRFKRYAVACIVFVVVALLQLAAPIGRG